MSINVKRLSLFCATSIVLFVAMLCIPSPEKSKAQSTSRDAPTILGWTETAVTVANTNRDGTGTVYRVIKVTASEGQFIDSIKCFTLGTNVTTEAVLIGSGRMGIGESTDNFILGNQQLSATTIGSASTSDVATFHIGAWFPKGFEIYAIVHTAQASGRQFVAFSHPSYQVH